MKTLISVLVVWVMFVLAGEAEAYGPVPTHRFITEKAAKVFVVKHHQYGEIVDSENMEMLLKGAEEEDGKDTIVEKIKKFATRSKNHFLRPTDGSGWFDESVEPGSKGTYVNAYQWALGNEYNWDVAVDAYLQGNKKFAFECLGHIVHLIQDCTVPAHTHLDTHLPPVSDDYENYCADLTRGRLAEYLIDPPITIPPTETLIPLQKLKELFYAAAWKSYKANRFPAVPPFNINDQWRGPLARMFTIKAVTVGFTQKWLIPGLGYLGKDWWECETDPGYYYLENTGLDTPIPFGWDTPLCERQSQELLPAAITYTAAVFKLFFETVAKELAPSLTVKVLNSDVLGPNTVSFDKNTEPQVKVTWKNMAKPDRAQAIWDDKQPVRCYIHLQNSNSGLLDFEEKKYLTRNTELKVSVRVRDAQTKVWVDVYSDILLIKVVPHPTRFYVSKNGTDETFNGPFRTIARALKRLKSYRESVRYISSSAIDTILVEPGLYNESPQIDNTPVYLIGQKWPRLGNPDEVIRISGTPENLIDLIRMTGGKEALYLGGIEGFHITQRMEVNSVKKILIAKNLFTKDNWSKGEDEYWGDWAITMNFCGSYIELNDNTFKTPKGVMLVEASPSFSRNLFTESCEKAICVLTPYVTYSNVAPPIIGGATSKANSFLNSTVFTTVNKTINAHYNWWGTTDKEELDLRLGQFVDYRYFLKSPPKKVGAPNPSDFDGDGQIGLDDFTSFAAHFNTQPTSPTWDSLYDLNADGSVGLDDFLLFIALYLGD